MKKRWNWIDTTIIVIILLVVIAFINKDKIINTGKKVVTSNEKDILIVLETDELTRDMVSDLKVGDQILSQNSLQNGFVEEVTIEPSLKTVVGPDGKIKIYEDDEEIKATIVLKAKVAFSGPYMDLGGQEVKIGIPFIMKTTKVEFSSTIKHIEVK